MTHRANSAKRFLVLFALMALVPLMPVRGLAEPTPGKNDRLLVQLVCGALQRYHLSKPEIDDVVSKRLFKKFLKGTDPSKLYFTKGDVDELKKSEGDLHTMLLQGDITFAYKVYELFLTRLGERMKLVEEFVKAPHDFTVKEYLSTDFDNIEYTNSADELRERWRKRIKFDLLMYRVGSKPLPEAEAKEKVLSRYQGLLKRWKQLDNYDLMELYLSDLTSAIDPHSSYMSPNTLADFDIAMRLQLEGIGALLRSENGQTIVAEVVPGGAASKDGRLKPKDKIIAVAQGDDKFTDVIDWKLTEVVKLIRGSKGTTVQLRVIPTGKNEPIVYNLTRQKIELKNQEAHGEVIEQGKKADGTPYRIGVIDLPSFYADMASARSGDGEFKSATRDVRKILNDFNAKQVDGVVLDLRRNGGGALSEALALTGLFIDEGPVVQVRDFQRRVNKKMDPEKGTVFSGPMMVLVSRLSASASEILAGALQDYGRALVVGDTATHGKGTVQQVIELGEMVRPEDPPKLGALKLTIQQFYRVNGDSTQNYGVRSDIVLPSITEELGTGEKELENALAFDQVAAANHEELGMVQDDVKSVLKSRSEQRVKKSADFNKLLKEIDQFKARRARKSIPLNEKELKEQTARDEADKTDEKLEKLLDTDSAPEGGAYKFARNFVNNEILQIMQDYLQGKKLLTSK